MQISVYIDADATSKLKMSKFYIKDCAHESEFSCDHILVYFSNFNHLKVDHFTIIIVFLYKIKSTSQFPRA